MSKISSRIDVAVAFYDVYLVIQFLPGFEPSESQIRTYYDNMWCVAHFFTVCTFSKSEKHPWRSVTFSKVAGCTKSRKALNIVYCNSHLVSFCLTKEENKTQKSWKQLLYYCYVILVLILEEIRYFCWEKCWYQQTRGALGLRDTPKKESVPRNEPWIIYNLKAFIRKIVSLANFNKINASSLFII